MTQDPPPQLVQNTWPRITSKSKCSRYLAQYLKKEGLPGSWSVTYKKKEGGKKTPNVPSLVPAQQNNHQGTWSRTYSKTCRDHGPRLNAKKEGEYTKKEEQIHMPLKARSSLEKKKKTTQIQIHITTEKDKAYKTRIVWKCTYGLAKKNDKG